MSCDISRYASLELSFDRIFRSRLRWFSHNLLVSIKFSSLLIYLSWNLTFLCTRYFFLSFILSLSLSLSNSLYLSLSIFLYSFSFISFVSFALLLLLLNKIFLALALIHLLANYSLQELFFRTQNREFVPSVLTHVTTEANSTITVWRVGNSYSGS